MKFALVDGRKEEATKGTIGLCQFCGSELIAKCGEVKVHHWSHKSTRNCDSWWENETDWHRLWKNEFPVEWQEVVHVDEKTGEKHVADVKTEAGWIIELQRSYLKPEERRSRDTFYKKLVWVVDGTRRKNDKKQFAKILKEEDYSVVWKSPLIIKVLYLEGCRLFKEWCNSNSLVFFDFEENRENKNSLLWLLYPHLQSGNIYLSRMNRIDFVQLSKNDGFDKLVRDVISPINKEILPMYEEKIRYRR